ncbi:MAG: hypothetical protein LC795_21060 [Acidobacteria bacterium]|nr:hypothetical protein [Acidobacteriota bacterium]
MSQRDVVAPLPLEQLAEEVFRRSLTRPVARLLESIERALQKDERLGRAPPSEQRTPLVAVFLRAARRRGRARRERSGAGARRRGARASAERRRGGERQRETAPEGSHH